MKTERIRESVIAGSWYPADPTRLRKQISNYLDLATPIDIPGKLTGLIVPHAGYVYSGGIAAHAYKLLYKHRFERVLILAPSHHAHFSGSSVYNLGGYNTPLGTVPLDTELIDELFKNTDIISYVPQADSMEHSLEIQLPFLQTVLPQFTLVPIVMGDQNPAHCRKLAEAIEAACSGKHVLMIASTDLSHYYPYDDAKRLDSVFLDRINAFDPEGLAEDIKAHKCEACGAGPVITLMLAAKKLAADSSTTLHYANSGDVTGDRSSGVVGYAAAALYKSSESLAPKVDEHNPRSTGLDLGYTSTEKEMLHELAYSAIRSRCMGEPMPQFAVDSPRLLEPRAAFVCIHKGKDLRGCIGMIEARAPLWDTIKRMAVEAAFGDPRFCALLPEELDEIDIEISVLTPLQRIRDPLELEIGKHGLYIRKGFHAGLLLPQVATEQGWNQTQFLEWTCKKAGLSKDAWRDRNAEIYTFSADVF
jgi:MEMO1 family protein